MNKDIVSVYLKELHRTISQLRSFERTLTSPTFEAMVEKMGDSNARFLEFLMEAKDNKGIRQLIRNFQTTTLDHMGVRDLRNRAQQLGVTYYSSKTKDELVEAIKKKESLLNEQE